MPDSASMMNSADVHMLADGAIKDHGKIRNIVSLLYDDDLSRRFVAVKALGEIARREPELMGRRWERIFHTFDDTMSCWGAAEALGEIARNLPGFRGRIALFLKVFNKDDCSCQGYVWGMCRICQVDSDRIKDFMPELERFLASPNVCIRAQAVWAVGELGIREASSRIEELLLDDGETWYFENDEVLRSRISTIAAAALKKIDRY